MYYVVVAATLFALPLLSIVVEAFVRGSSLDLPLLTKWYAFWAVGVRLSLAGIRQAVQPRYTARVILGLKGDESLPVVRELGFANAAIGLIGLLSIVFASWRNAIALAGGVFYSLAGANHIAQAQRNRFENVAMVSDLLAAAVLLTLVVAGVFKG